MIGGGIVNDNLIFHFDAANPRSYPGEATTNLISQVNAYPSVGNGWGTYNVNQYNGAKYFSIGTVSGVSDNVVTMTAAHPLRTYDVVRPQTTGGGLTAGTNYYIKKVSTTQFSVHQYLSTQDGSLGFTCLANIQSNTKISINATNFPTMWWGPPHLPNSGIIKTIIPNGFNFEGRKHDCLRHHAYRPDSVVDGMAYGVNPTIGSGVTHTISCMMRATTADSVYISWQAYWAGSTPQSAILFGGNLTRKWTKYTYTKTTIAGATYLILYWLSQTAKSAIDISEIQVELNKDHATLFTVGTRDGNGVDLVSGNTLTFTGTTQNATDKSIIFDGNNDYIDCGNDSSLSLGYGTLSVWAKTTRQYPSDTSSYIFRGLIGKVLGGGTGQQSYWIDWYGTNSVRLLRVGIGDSSVSTAAVYSYDFANKWTNIVGTWNSTTIQLYVNGELCASATHSIVPQILSNPVLIGSCFGKWDGYIAQSSIYNKTLTAAQIKQNFYATKGRFGL